MKKKFSAIGAAIGIMFATAIIVYAVTNLFLCKINVTGLFKQVQLDLSRTCVFWDEDIDLASDTIYEYGKTL